MAARACIHTARSGFPQLLVLAGPTFTERLWALVEIYVFVWSQVGCQ